MQKRLLYGSNYDVYPSLSSGIVIKSGFILYSLKYWQESGLL